MDLKTYLKNFSDRQQITLVGPVSPKPPEPTDNPIVFIDGGSRWSAEIEGGISVGDGDSSDRPMDEPLPKEKDQSDFAYALSKIPQNFTEIHCSGFLSERRDHEIFNMGEAHHFLCDRKNKTKVIFGDGLTAYSGGLWSLDLEGGFSLWMFEKGQLRISGDCDYKVHPPKTWEPVSSRGLSNRGFGKVQIDTIKPFFIQCF